MEKARRACCIVIRDSQLLFVQQTIREGALRQVFIGGAIEEDETPHEAALRELAEEANVQGEIIFGPALYEATLKEYVFIVRIPDDAQPTLGYDPELAHDKQVIHGLIWRDAVTAVEQFNRVDCAFFQAVVDEAEKMDVQAPWRDVLEGILHAKNEGEGH